MSNQPSPLSSLLDRKVKVYVNATGAGAGLQKRIWEIAGCSSFFVGSHFPYGPVKTCNTIGYEPSSFCSKETAIALAMASYMEAYDPFDGADDVVGIGLTASVASLKAHKGDHRVFVAAISNTKCIVYSMVIQKGDASYRAADGELADELGELALLKVLGLPTEPSEALSGNALQFSSEEIPNEDLINLIMKRPYIKADGTKSVFDREDFPCEPMFYPGTFDPFHYGHANIGAAAKAKFIANYSVEPELIYSTCINPKHKAPPTPAALLKKISQMKGNNFLLTKDDALYLEKAEANPGCSFIVGADALLTMMDPKWGHNILVMLETFSQLNVEFYVVGRVVDGVFTTLEDVKNKHPDIRSWTWTFKNVEGRWDVSSTELRNQK